MRILMMLALCVTTCLAAEEVAPAEAQKESAVPEPFADAVARVEGETAEILNPKFAKAEEAEAFSPCSLGSAPSGEYVKEYQKLISGGKALLLSTQEINHGPLARLRFRVSKAGRYYIFLLGDAWCCGCGVFEFRLDNGPKRLREDLWLWDYGWRSLGVRQVGKTKHGSPVTVAEPFDLEAGEHSVEILSADPICGGMIIDALAVARFARLETGDDWHGRKLLHYAVKQADRAMVKFLLARGASVNVRDDEHRTPLMYAEKAGHEEIAALLRARGAIPSDLERRFLAALRKGDLAGGEAAARAAPALLDARYTGRVTPLHVAAKHGHTEVARFLIDRGAPVNAGSEGKRTPLHAASENGRAETARLLLTKGADARARDWCGNPPLHLAARGGHRQVVAVFLAAGIDADLRDAHGWTPLHDAAVRGRGEVAGLLLAKGAEVKAKNDLGRTPLDLASGHGDAGTVKLLIEGGANVNSRNEWDGTPLHAAVWAGHIEVAKLLIAAGANVNARTDNGITPLHRAASRWSADLTELLLKHGADVNAKDESGRTPLDWARGKKVRELLRSRGAEEAIK